MRYSINVRAIVHATKTIEVNATDAETAREYARRRADFMTLAQWDLSDPEDVQVEGCYAAEPAWIIGGPVEDGARLYWSNDLGWTTLDGATTFTDADKATHALPVGGEWWPA